MKRIYLILLLFFCSCSIDDSFSKTCVQEIKSSSFSEKTIYDIKYDGDDIVEKAIVVKNYKSFDGNDITSDIKKVIGDYNNKYGGTGIKYSVNKDLEDEYEIEYFIPVKSLDENILNDFKLEKNSVKLFRSFKKENIECEGQYGNN